MRILPVNLSTILVELKNLEETLALFESLRADAVPAIAEMVPAARTLMIRFDPTEMTAEALASELVRRDLTAVSQSSDQVIEIPVEYDGEDLADVAELTGLSVDEVIRRHNESEYTVAFCGFAPGFGYLTGGDPALVVPRRKSPRTKIPAGAVALAGNFSGVYPQASPGGWQIIGVTPLKMWDIERDPPALFQPGYRVKFRPIRPSDRAAAPLIQQKPSTAFTGSSGKFTVITAAMPATFQDLGRFGKTGQGVSSAGALDRASFRAANQIVGNAGNEACLEITLGGFSFTTSERAVIAFTGAPCPISIRDASGRNIPARPYQPIPLEPGDVISLAAPSSGMRTYLAVRGGFDVKPVLGSRSSDTLAIVGPDLVTADSELYLADGRSHLESVSLDEQSVQLPTASDVVTLDVVLGPRADWFTQKGIDTLSQQLWTVTPQSSRVGIRLTGDLPLERIDTAELPSEGTATGAIQVPHSGQPVLFLADHPLTGGYPVIGNVADYHLDLAGQIPINAKIRFRPIGPFAEISAATR